MRVIPVIDLMGGLVVRGVAGRRKEYRPVESRLADDPRPATVARAFADQFGFDTVYVADLDAIMHGRPDVPAWQAIAAAGLRLWLDAGVGSRRAAQQMMEQVARIGVEAKIVVGLEALESEEELMSICAASSGRLPIFSLDMKDGLPLVRNPAWRDWSPLRFVELATNAGIRDQIVLDLADVGTRGGTRTLDLCREIRRVPKVRNLIAGGGVRGSEDLRALASAGCDAALVASALHDGRLQAADIGQI